MVGELLGAPAVVDDDLTALVRRLPPEVDGLAVIADDVAVADAVREQRATVVELEPLVAALRSGDDLDFLAFELVAKHGDPFSRKRPLK